MEFRDDKFVTQKGDFKIENQPKPEKGELNANMEPSAERAGAAEDVQMLRDPLLGYGLAQPQSEEVNRETGF